MRWNLFEAYKHAPVGGAVRGGKKAAAARKNGLKGGRRRNSTLAEFIMRRTLTATEHKAVFEGFVQLTLHEKDIFRRFFDLPLAGKRKADAAPLFDPTTKDGIRAKKPTKRMRYILTKVRFVARHRIASGF
jgi:hypothetical protein